MIIQPAQVTAEFARTLKQGDQVTLRGEITALNRPTEPGEDLEGPAYLLHADGTPVKRSSGGFIGEHYIKLAIRATSLATNRASSAVNLPRKRYEREEFRNALKGKMIGEVRTILGNPDLIDAPGVVIIGHWTTANKPAHIEGWHYYGLTYQGSKVDAQVWIWFEYGSVERVVFP